MSKKPVRVAVTGAAGQIGYALLFRIASGEMLGKDQPVILQLLEVPVEGPQKALKGVMMELEDCAFPLLVGMEAHGDPMTAFKDVDYALLVGSRPRGPGMERAELLAVNGVRFTCSATDRGFVRTQAASYFDATKRAEAILADDPAGYWRLGEPDGATATERQRDAAQPGSRFPGRACRREEDIRDGCVSRRLPPVRPRPVRCHGRQ